MKTIILSALALIFSACLIPASGGNNGPNKSQTLFGSDIRHGGWGGMHYGMIFVHGNPELLRGVRGAWVINFHPEHAVNIGFGNYRTATNFEPVEWEFEDIDEPELRLRNRGLEIEYVNQTLNLFHFSGHITLGSGTVRYNNPDETLVKTRDSYFSIQPVASVNMNVTSWFRLNLSAGYHYAGNVNLHGTGRTDLSGFVSFVGLKFGSF